MIQKIEKAGKLWEKQNLKSVNSSNLNSFSFWYCDQNKNGNSPSQIKEIAEKIFCITPTQNQPDKKTILETIENLEVIIE